MAKPLFAAVRRRLRRLAGKGWSAEDFAARYRRGAEDAWGYRQSPEHARRAEWILQALPEARFAKALEVGCAQGFLTERLAPRVERLIACDISSRAVAAAREACRAFPAIEFRVADVRQEFPGDALDLCLFSDVLYYLSQREIDATLNEAARRVAGGGHLVIANEWNPRYRGLTPPTYAFSRLDADPNWERTHSSRMPLGPSTLHIGVYRRRSTLSR